MVIIMAKLGTPVTPFFAYGAFEVRLGPLYLAGRLSQANSIGLCDDMSTDIAVNTTDLKGGAPQVIYDTAITGTEGTVTVTTREQSRYNLGLQAGNGALAAAVDFISTLKSASGAGGDLDLTATGFVVNLVAAKQILAGDILTIWKAGYPESVSVVKVTAAAGNAGADQTITIGTTSVPGGLANSNNLSVVYSAADIAAGLIKVAKQAPVQLGNVDAVHYFSAAIIQVDRPTQRPRPINIWKCTIGSGFKVSGGGTEFGSNQLILKVLPPTIAEVASGGVLEHIAPYYNAGHYSGMVSTFSDAAPSV
jgi:hypothetical protein